VADRETREALRQWAADAEQRAQEAEDQAAVIGAERLRHLL